MQRRHQSGYSGVDGLTQTGSSGSVAAPPDVLAQRVEPQGGCYGVQILVAGRRKGWRNDVCAQIRRAGFCATTVDSGVDALTVLVLGIPVDVLVTDAELQGELCCSRLAAEAKALRPNLGIIYAGDESAVSTLPPDAIILPADAEEEGVTKRVRQALRSRAPADAPEPAHKRA